MSFAELMSRKYDSANYNCAHLVAEAWKMETGEDLSEVLAGFMKPRRDRKVEQEHMRKFTKLDTPQSPSIVVMRQGKNRLHVGMFIRGKILQIRQGGVTFLPIHTATMGYTRVRFYA